MVTNSRIEKSLIDIDFVARYEELFRQGYI